MKIKRSAMPLMMGLILLSSCAYAPQDNTPTSAAVTGPPAPTPADLPATPQGKTPTPGDPGTAWGTQIDSSGASIAYPASWEVEVVPGGAVFVSPEGSRILWEVSPRPESERSLADPWQWMPNEGGYEIHWSKDLTIAEAAGLEFIWGSSQAGQWGAAPQLMAVVYSAEKELDIRLSTFFDARSIEALDELGPEDAISAHFAVFEQMLQSVRLPND